MPKTSPRDPCKSQDLTVTIDLGEDGASDVAISEGNVDTAALKTAKGEADAAFEALRSARDDLRKAARALDEADKKLSQAKKSSADSGVLKSLEKTKKDAKTAKDSADEEVSEKSDALGKALSDFENAWSALHGREPLCNGRWITDPSKVHHLTVVAMAVPGPGKLSIDISETKRKTRLAEDVATLIKVLPILETRGLETQPPRIVRKEYVLKEKRANLEILVQESGAGTAKTELAKKSLVTGPSEHWALSANAVLNQVKEVKVTDDNTFDVKDTPDKFLIGLDYYFGDLMSDWRGSSFAKNLGLKLLVEGSTRPGDRLGVALTYRGDAGPLSLKLISPFAGALWTRSTELDDEGKIISRGDLEGPEWVFGLSFNLDRALEWLK